MSAFGDLRDLLEEIHDMLPLSERERKLAHRAIVGDGETDLVAEIEGDAEWYGEKAVKAFREVIQE